MGGKRRRAVENRQRRKIALKRRRANSNNSESVLRLAPGITAKLRGKRILIENRQTTEQRDLLFAERQVQASRLRELVPQNVIELRHLLKSLPTLQLWSGLAAATIIHTPRRLC